METKDLHTILAEVLERLDKPTLSQLLEASIRNNIHSYDLTKIVQAVIEPMVKEIVIDYMKQEHNKNNLKDRIIIEMDRKINGMRLELPSSRY